MPISEYIIKQKNEGAVLFKKISVILGYVLLALLLCVTVIALAPPLLYLPFFCAVAAFMGITVFATWRFFCVEYEIVIGNGELCATAIYGRSTTKKLLSVSISDLEEIGVYDDDAYERLCTLRLQKDLQCISSLSAPEMYYAIYTEDKKRCVIYFETDERGISILKRTNPSAFRKAN